MSVAPIEKSKSSTGSLNTSSTSLVISKESGVTLVHPDGKELPESFEYVKPEKAAGMYVWACLGLLVYFAHYCSLFFHFKLDQNLA